MVEEESRLSQVRLEIFLFKAPKTFPQVQLDLLLSTSPQLIPRKIGVS